MLDSFSRDSIRRLHIDRIVGVEAAKSTCVRATTATALKGMLRVFSAHGSRTVPQNNAVTRMDVATICCIRWTTISEYVPLGLEQVHTILR
jgi:hypothetical protein